MDFDSKDIWKNDPQTRKFLAAIRAEIKLASKELADGTLLVHETNEKIAREYAGVIGYIEGLKYVSNYLEDESYDRSQPFSGENGNRD